MDSLTCWHSAPPREIRTDRTLVHLLGPEDADELTRFLSSERQHLAFYDLPATAHELRAVVDTMIAARDAKVHYVLRTGGAIIGGATVDIDRIAGIAELSAWLGSAHGGQRYASEVARALCDVVATSARVATIFTRFRHASDASAPIMRRLGFVRGPDMGELQAWHRRCADYLAWQRAWSIAAAFGASVPGDDGRICIATPTVTLAIHVACCEERPYIVTTARLGGEHSFSLRAALQHSSTLLVGTLALRDEEYVLRYGCAAEGFTAACLDLLVHEAQRLHALIPRRQISTDAFACAL